MKISFLLTTYNRPQPLEKLLEDLDHLFKLYEGKDIFEILVCFSDKKIPLPNLEIPIRYIESGNKGFDHNLFNGFKNVKDCDYVYLLGDDDIFYLNPFTEISEVIKSQKRCYIFDHYNPGLVIREKSLVEIILPRYCGILYRIDLVKESLRHIVKFKNTLHAYAVPFLCAKQNEVEMIDKKLMIFNDTNKNDGAWVCKKKVVTGLKKFLKGSKFFVSKEVYEEMKSVFTKHFFAKNSLVFGKRISRSRKIKNYFIQFLKNNIKTSV
jgi:glycosyltransferase involved in cell wall biosynthesis